MPSKHLFHPRVSNLLSQLVQKHLDSTSLLVQFSPLSFGIGVFPPTHNWSSLVIEKDPSFRQVLQFAIGDPVTYPEIATSAVKNSKSVVVCAYLPFRTAVVGQYLTALATDCYLSRGWFTPLSISKLQDGDFIEKRVGSSIQNDGVGRTKLVLVLERQLVTSLFQSTSKLTPANDQIATPKYRTRLGAFITPAFTITDSQLVPSTLFSRHFESQRIPLSYSPVDFVIVTLEVHKSANGVFAGYDSIRTFKNLLKMTHALPGRTAQVAFDGIEDAKGILASVGVDEECRVGDIPVNTLVQIAAIGHARGIRGLAHGF